MSSPLLETKFHLPTPHGRLIPRARLSQRVERAAAATLTLVSAPAGFGKTTLMAELASRSGGPHVAWLSLDPGDNDPVTFWTYVIEAVDRAAPGVGSAARSIIATAQAPVDAAVTTLLNALAGAEADVVLVLDDFHVIESPSIHAQVGYLLEHLPARGHLVIGTRADPAIPLSRLRARGGLVEIRASDLRFSVAEAASYLAVMGLSLTDGNVATLEARTEGWIAALQLAALSLQGRADPTDFIAAFAGDDRYIVDYLVEEVLRRQPAETRDFLLQTSILSRFTGSLADAVTAGEGGLATIEALDRANLFLVPLDNQRRWYRYHHLFGGVLRAYLAAEMPGEVSDLHRRASDWFEQNGEPGEAIEHAFRAGDPQHAADLVELAIPEMRQYRHEPTMRRWMDSIPREIVARRPALAVGYAGTILSANEVEGVAKLLDGAERQIEATGERSATEGAVVLDATEFKRLPAMIELYRAALAKIRGDLDGNIAHARRVLDLVGETDYVGRGGAAAFLGLAYWGMGDLEAGYRWYVQGMAELEKAGYIADLVGGTIVRADIRLAEGRLGDAMRMYEEGLALANRSEPPLRGAADMHTGLADIAYQRGRLDDARTQLDAGRRLGDAFAFPRQPYRSKVVEARIRQAEGDLDGAVALLHEAERLYLSEFSPDVRPVAAVRARMLVAHGRLAEARAWAQTFDISPVDPVSYVREFEHTTLARLLVAEASENKSDTLATALALLERLLAAAEQGHRNGSRLEILVVQALARNAAGDRAGAFAALDAAVALAEPEGYVRVFLDEGPAMTRLLKDAARQPNASPAVRELLRAASGGSDRPPAQHGTVDPLSERELEVLRLLRSDLDGPEMARELVVSLNTLTKNIYAKLGVGSRRAAVRRAEELGLL
jgi:LuxR family transcriptional regulator, maltose regulon positive regulatory protein